jgi:uncharacterized membrane protein/subtilisin family serine protease
MDKASFSCVGIVLILLIGSFSPILALSGAVDQAGLTVSGSYVQPTHLLRLRAGTFDPIEGIPLPDDLLVKGPTEYLIVQFDGPIHDAWVRALEDLGCEVIWYLPDDAFLVYAPGVSQSELSAFDQVRYVGPYHPGYKLSPALFTGPEANVIYITPLRDSVVVALAVMILGGTVTAVNDNLVRGYLPREHLLALASLPEVGFIEPGGGGSFLMDNDARILHARQNVDGNFTNDGLSLWSWNGSAFQGTTGKGIKVMVTDTGIDGTHPDFDGRKIYFSPLNSGYANWTDYFGHGTHCAGIVLGNGTYRPPPAPQGQKGTYAGIAPEALLLGEIINWDANDDLMYGRTVNDVISDTEAHGAQVSSNSWSCCGTVQVYGVTSQIYDNAVRDSNKTKEGDQSIVYVFAAGNSGAGNIITPGVAKNVITVGAVGDNRGFDENSLAGFSSRGPTADGRRKPDVVAPGVNVMSALANNPNFSFVGMSGTSMATPGVAGASTLVLDYFNKTYGFIPSPAMVKAVFVNGADQLVNPSYKYADSNQGWGRVNLSRSLLETNGRKVWGEDQKHLLSTDQSVDYYFNVSTSNELRIHIAYTDPGAAPPVSRALVNDLDLIAFAPNGTQYNASYFVKDYSATGGTPDNLNNVEGLRFKDPAVGQWRVRVFARDVPNGPQDYALTINGWTDISLHDIDLKVLDLNFSKASPPEGDTVLWKARIMNDALIPLDNVGYNVKLDGNLLMKGTMPYMDRHGIVEVSGNWTAVRGNHTISVEADPLGLIIEKDRTNNVAMGKLFVSHYGLAVDAKAVVSSVLPGALVHWLLTVNNTGTLPDSYNMTWGQIPKGWSATIPTSVQLGPGTGKTLAADIQTPMDAYAGARLSLPITVTSKALPVLKVTVHISAIVLQRYVMTVSLGPSTQMVPPDTSVNYNISISNHGNGPDSFSIGLKATASGTTEWGYGTPTHEVRLDPGGSTVVPLQVYASPSAIASDNCTVEVTVTSRGNSSMSAHGTVLTVVASRPLLLSSISPPVIEVSPGARPVLDLKVMDLGNSHENVTYSVTVPSGWPAVAKASQISLAPSGTKDFLVQVMVPADALAGDYRCLITALWVNGSSYVTISQHPVTIRVRPVHGLTIEVQPSLLNGTTGDVFKLYGNLRNTGNAQEDITVGFSGLNDNWSLTGGAFILSLQPGASATCEAWIRTINGTAGNYTITVTAYYADGKTVSASIPLTLAAPPPQHNPPPVNPPPVYEPHNDSTGLYIMIGLLLLILIIICIVVLVLWSRRRKREMADQTVTAEAWPDEPSITVPPPSAPKPAEPKPKEPIPEVIPKEPEPAPTKPEADEPTPEPKPMEAGPEATTKEPSAQPSGPPTEGQVQSLIDEAQKLIEEAERQGKDVKTPNSMLRLATSFKRSGELEKASTYAQKAKDMVLKK